jgi:REP element-mobilizing transposase RayT
MANLQPIYTAQNCKIAYQLDWSFSLFWKSSPGSDNWFSNLQESLEQDGIRLLNHRFPSITSSLFLVSSRPDVPPLMIPQRIKGRLQQIVRQQHPKAFQRNYELRSIGSTHREKIEDYLESQLTHHAGPGARRSAQLADLQVVRPDVNLSRFGYTAHARNVCNLHLVFVNNLRCQETRLNQLAKLRAVILSSAQKKQHRLSRASVLPEHIYLTRGIGLEISPIEIALSYMNNIAWVYDMKPVLMSSCYIGGFGEYDLGAIKTKKPS